MLLEHGGISVEVQFPKTVRIGKCEVHGGADFLVRGYIRVPLPRSADFPVRSKLRPRFRFTRFPSRVHRRALLRTGKSALRPRRSAQSSVVRSINYFGLCNCFPSDVTV